MEQEKRDRLFYRLMNLDEESKCLVLARLYGRLEAPHYQNFNIDTLEMIETLVIKAEEKNNPPLER